MSEKVLRNRQDLDFLFRRVMNILHFSDIKVILFYGSLLGVVRDGAFVEGDDDIDVLMERKEYNRLLEAIGEDPNISIGIGHPDIVQLYYNEIGPFDIYMIDVDSKAVRINWEKDVYGLKDFYPLNQVIMHGYPVYIPRNSEKIIEKTYGTNWRTPLKKGEYPYESGRNYEEGFWY